jgi:fatty-acyl-CoA synthase
MTPPLTTLRAAAVVARAASGVSARPTSYVGSLWAMRRHGMTAIGAVAASAARTPRRTALIDDGAPITYAELWERTNALAAGLADQGVDQESRVGLLAGNGLPFVQALLACLLLGSRVVLLNTRSAPAQFAVIAQSEQLDLVICDDDHAKLAASMQVRVVEAEQSAVLIASHLRKRPRPSAPGRIVLLTSGTTGAPKGAHRPTSGELVGSAAVLSRIPLRRGDVRLIAAPLFHGWGLTHLLLALGMSATVVVQPRFDAEESLRAIEEHHVRVAVLVPVMLQRILELPPDLLARVDTSGLRIVACSGSALPGWVATDCLRRFGPVLYNVYGSTEVSLASIATPADLIASPRCAGRPVLGALVQVLDDNDRPVPAGTIGRVFVSSALQFDGYTEGEGRRAVDGLLDSGDVGCFDRRGRLTIVGRSDDMIVSGGENVYPRDVEDVLCSHPDIAEVVVLGVPDGQFGAALQAWIVCRPGSELDEDGVREYVRARLASYQIPRRVVFVSELGRNAMGKVLRAHLVTA